MDRSSNPLKRTLTDEQINKLYQCMEEFVKFDPEMPLQLQLTFLYIASHDGCHKQALEEELGYSNAAGSRNTDYLAAQHRYQLKGGAKKGMNLISKDRDPSNRRRYSLTLTKQGHALVKSLKKKLYGKNHDVLETMPRLHTHQSQGVAE
jgi:DNA-binding MarR family transcriptional regulator